ncbi:MAG: FtsQ-type POTRA domain-containing protein [Clostridia bacterium]|nr:FtsQ-type POTRA domain-containing protein [Clostridia bacterium]
MSYDVRRLKGFLTIAVALLIIALTAVLLVILLFRADKFEIVGTELYDESEILSASGINEGVFLYSVDKENAERSILEKCTLISKATVVVRMPNKVIISVTEDVPVFYTSVGVSTVMFGYDLRIGDVKQNSTIGEGISVELPEISSAVAGSRLQFVNGEPTYIQKILEAAVRCNLFDRITLINCESTREAFFEVDGKYKLILGGTADLEIKLTVAEEYLENPRIANAEYAILDLTSPKEVLVTVND